MLHRVEASCDGGSTWGIVSGPLEEDAAAAKKREIDYQVISGIVVRVVPAETETLFFMEVSYNGGRTYVKFNDNLTYDEAIAERDFLCSSSCVGAPVDARIVPMEK